MRVFLFFSIVFLLGSLMATNPEITIADTLIDSLVQTVKEDTLKEPYIVIDLQNFRLFLFENDELKKDFPIATGKNMGDKKMVGDCRTPLGDFKIEKIESSAQWVYDYGDGKGYVKAYGPWFIRLETHADQTFSGKAWTGIGIHGTHEEESIGTRVSRGCLRMHSDHLKELVEFLHNLPDLHIKVYIREVLNINENFDPEHR